MHRCTKIHLLKHCQITECNQLNVFAQLINHVTVHVLTHYSSPFHWRNIQRRALAGGGKGGGGENPAPEL